MILPDYLIERHCTPHPLTGRFGGLFGHRQPLISPFVARKMPYAGVTHGLGSCSYDLTLGTQFAFKHWSEWVTIDLSGDEVYVLRAGCNVLAHTIEKLHMPPDVMGIIHDKSTWARRFVAVQNTLDDPGFHGQLTLEISNHSDEDVTLVPGMGICQIVFHQLAGPCRRPYNGRYQCQSGVTLPKEAVHA